MRETKSNSRVLEYMYINLYRGWNLLSPFLVWESLCVLQTQTHYISGGIARYSGSHPKEGVSQQVAWLF